VIPAAVAAALTGAYIAMVVIDRSLAVSAAIFYFVALALVSVMQEINRRAR
jgi:hypothetical protein